MPSHVRFQTIVFAVALSLSALCASSLAQARDDFDTEAADPMKLFNRGQDAHQKGDFQLALDSYEEALKLRPEFPEAEFQKGSALVSLNRETEAERAFRRAVELRKDWAMPHVGLASIFVRAKRDRDAETSLRRALDLEPKNLSALVTLASLRLRAGAAPEAVALMRRATAAEGSVPASIWALRGAAERAAGDKIAAMTSLGRALEIDPNESTARAERAEVYATDGDYARAVEDVRVALKFPPMSSRIPLSLRLAMFLLKSGRRDEARQVINELSTVPAEHARAVEAILAELAAVDENTPEARKALEEILKRDPRNATVLTRLGAFYRIIDPQKSLDYYARAVAIEPSNIDYAIGYAAALVQTRNFEQAATILQKIITLAPDNHAAHANLATALDAMKLYREALIEYQWLNRNKPDLVITYYFIGRAHDMLGEFTEALAAYETFLAGANPQANGTEIDRVKLRLPSLRNQIARGEGSKNRRKGKR